MLGLLLRAIIVARVPEADDADTLSRVLDSARWDELFDALRATIRAALREALSLTFLGTAILAKLAAAAQLRFPDVRAGREREP